MSPSLESKRPSWCRGEKIKKGKEQFTLFFVLEEKGPEVRFFYDYRSENHGKLFSCIRKTKQECHESRNNWLKRHDKNDRCSNVGKSIVNELLSK